MKLKIQKLALFGDTAVVALELIQKGMLVDNKAFTGEHMVINWTCNICFSKATNMENCTFILSKIEGYFYLFFFRLFGFLVCFD